MAPFVDQTDHYSRSIHCGWPARSEGVDSVAGRLQALARALTGLEPAHGSLWPALYPRPRRPGDPGPILEMQTDEFARLLDRRTRFDPPPLPAPVGPEGYSVALTNDLVTGDPLGISLGVLMGQSGDSRLDSINVEIAMGNAVWRDMTRMMAVFDVLIDVLDPKWICASAYVSPQVNGDAGTTQPWVAWIATDTGTELPLPYPFWKIGPPTGERPWRDGTLQTWS